MTNFQYRFDENKIGCDDFCNYAQTDDRLAHAYYNDGYSTGWVATVQLWDGVVKYRTRNSREGEEAALDESAKTFRGRRRLLLKYCFPKGLAIAFRAAGMRLFGEHRFHWWWCYRYVGVDVTDQDKAFIKKVRQLARFFSGRDYDAMTPEQQHKENMKPG